MSWARQDTLHTPGTSAEHLRISRVSVTVVYTIHWPPPPILETWLGSFGPWSCMALSYVGRCDLETPTRQIQRAGWEASSSFFCTTWCQTKLSPAPSHRNQGMKDLPKLTVSSSCPQLWDFSLRQDNSIHKGGHFNSQLNPSAFQGF